jgi:hypothetical protein
LFQNTCKKTNALFKTNCIEDWESKIDAIVEETFNENMTVISGIPSWVKCILSDWSKKEEAVGDILKFQLVYLWGVNYEPYRAKFKNLIGRKVDSIELFPASEGFFAYQDSQRERGITTTLEFRDFLRIYKE